MPSSDGYKNLIPFTKNDPRRINKPKGSVHISTYIQKILEDPDFELKLKDGTVIEGAPIKAIIQAAVIKAAKGDMRAFDMLGKYGYGTKLDITSGGKELPRPIIPLDVNPEDGSALHSDNSNDQGN